MSRNTTWAILFASLALLALIGLFQTSGLLVGLAVCVPLALLSIALCQRLDPQLVDLFVIALLLRWAGAAFIHLAVYTSDGQPVYGKMGLFSPDEIFYEAAAHTISESWAGHEPPLDGQFPAQVWLMSTCYYLFGDCPLLPKLLNGLAGAWNVVITGLLATQIFSSRVARRAALLATLTPSLILWSTLNTKDNWSLFGAELALLAFLGLRERFRPWLLGLGVCGLALVGATRPYEVVFVGMGIPASLFTSTRRPLRNVILFMLLAATVLTVLDRSEAFAFMKSNQESTLERLNTLREGYLGGRSSIDVSNLDTSTPLGLVLAVPVGLVYFFFAPLPFSGGTFISLATAPEMIVWYLLMLSLVRGLRFAIRERLRRAAPLLFYALFSAVGWSLVVTNIGTLFRYRAQMLFVALIVIAADQVQRRDARSLAAGSAIRSLQRG